MARPLRVELEGGLYHVIARGRERRGVFRDDADRRQYLERLAFYAGKLSFRVVAYCLLDDQAHFAIEKGKAPLSKIMAGLQSSYAQYFHRRHGRPGSLFRGRYKAFLVEKDRYGLALLRFIHGRPVDARRAARAEDFEWSSDRFYRRGRGPEWMDLDLLLSKFARRRPAALRAYRRMMREPVEEPYVEAARRGQAVKGDKGFADRVRRAAGEAAEVPRRGVTVELVARRVAREEGVALSRMRGPGRERPAARARMMAAWLAREVGRIPVARTARYFGRDTSTIITGLNRLEAAMAEDRGLRRRLGRLKEAVSASGRGGLKRKG